MDSKKSPILLVDDFSLIRELLREPLSRLGLENLMEAANGKEALAIIDRQKQLGSPVSLVICDLNMPEMDGMELLQHLRSKKEFENLPVVVLSVEGDPATIEKAMSLGASDFLVKPVNAATLERRLTNLFSNRPRMSCDDILERALGESAQKVFQGYFNCELQTAPLTQLMSNPKDWIVTSVTMQQTWMGKTLHPEAVMYFSFSNSYLMAMIQNLFKYEVPKPALNEVAGELTNNIYGLTKARINSRGHTFGMAIPSLVSGASEDPHKCSASSNGLELHFGSSTSGLWIAVETL